MTINTWSNDEEYFQYDSLPELMDSHSELCIGDTVYVGEVNIPSASKYVDVNCILATISDSAYDDVGEYSDGWPDLSKEEHLELEEMIVCFINKKSPITFYNVVNIKEYVITREDIDE